MAMEITNEIKYMETVARVYLVPHLLPPEAYDRAAECAWADTVTGIIAGHIEDPQAPIDPARIDAAWGAHLAHWCSVVAGIDGRDVLDTLRPTVVGELAGLRKEQKHE